MMVMKLLSMENGESSPFDGQYVKEYDPDRAGVDPDGRPMTIHLVTTSRKEEAKTYAHMGEFHAEWTRVPKGAPIRFDGEPNRPLTAFSVTNESV
jgi:hypothetical protein